MPTITRAAPAPSSRGGALLVAHSRIHPRLRPQAVRELPDGPEMASRPGDRVEVGDVDRRPAAYVQQRPRERKRIASGDQPAAHGLVGVPLAAQALHHAATHEV